MEWAAPGLQVEDQVNAPVIGMVEGFVDGLVVEAPELAGVEHRTSVVGRPETERPYRAAFCATAWGLT